MRTHLKPNKLKLCIQLLEKKQQQKKHDKLITVWLVFFPLSISFFIHLVPSFFLFSFLFFSFFSVLFFSFFLCLFFSPFKPTSEGVLLVDDTDASSTAEEHREYLKWRQREIQRIKKAMEEREEFFRMQDELRSRDKLTDEDRRFGREYIYYYCYYYYYYFDFIN